MSIIDNVERYMKRYDYLIQKREKQYNKGKRLSQEEDEELLKLKPNVITPILVMFELLHDTIKKNQTIRKSMNRHSHQTQIGGANSVSPSAIAIAAVAAAEASASAPAVAAASVKKDEPDDNKDKKDNTNDDDDNESQRLSELEESLLPLLTKIIVYIEQNKNKEKKKEEEEEEEKYPDIGTSVKNSAILVIRRIKKWWNDLIAGGSSDLSSKINLKKAIPQLANNPGDMNKLNAKAEELNALAEKATDAIDAPLKKIERILTNDVRDIASSSVEGIMNALSLIPGIGTTLQLWRLLQNVIVIMSKSVTTMAGAKKEGVELKQGIQEIKGDVEALGDPSKLAAGAPPGMQPEHCQPEHRHSEHRHSEHHQSEHRHSEHHQSEHHQSEHHQREQHHQQHHQQHHKQHHQREQHHQQQHHQQHHQQQHHQQHKEEAVHIIINQIIFDQ